MTWMTALNRLKGRLLRESDWGIAMHGMPIHGGMYRINPADSPIKSWLNHQRCWFQIQWF
jgi:hypothetical protein